MSRNACLTVTGLLLAGLALGGASVLAADRTTPPRAEVRGELEVVTEDDFKTGQSREFHYLRSVKGERTHAIHFEGVQAPLLATGTGVVVRGSLRADGLLVVGADPADGVVAISFAETETTSDPNPLSTRSTTEDRRTLVMVLDFQDATVSCSDSEIESIMFTGAESVDDLYNESSFGALRFPPDTDGDTEPDVMRLSIDMTTSGTCDRYAWAAAADTVAENAGVDFYQYQHRVYVLPATGNTCTWAGAANVGCPSYCRTWVRYCTFPDVYAHELGHNLYMRHASTDTNDDGVADCEYCDTSDFI